MHDSVLWGHRPEYVTHPDKRMTTTVTCMLAGRTLQILKQLNPENVP